jgi:hypothetical protein
MSAWAGRIISQTEVLMNDPSKMLTKHFIKENADSHYVSRDKRMRVWAWHQVLFIKISGTWTPETTEIHLNELWCDFTNLRQSWSKVFAIIGCTRFRIQSEIFRSNLKTDWDRRFKRKDLVVCLIDNNAMRRAIRSVMPQLIVNCDNIFVFKNCDEILGQIWMQLLTAA